MLFAAPCQVAAAAAADVAPARAAGDARARAAEAPPPAGEIHLGYGLAGGATEWSGDPLVYTALTIGLRIRGVVTPFVGGGLGYAAVDQRLLTRLDVGVAVGARVARRFRPYGYVAFVHQHEESLAAVAQEPLGALFGIGSGIRHRAGVHFGIGLDVALRTTATYELALGPHVSAMYLGYSVGPGWSVFGGATATLHVRLF